MPTLYAVQPPADADSAQLARAAAEAQALAKAAAKVGSCFWLELCASCCDRTGRTFVVQAEADRAEARRLEEARQAAAKVCAWLCACVRTLRESICFRALLHAG